MKPLGSHFMMNDEASRFSHFQCFELLTLAFHSVCVCVSSPLANNGAQEVRQDKRPDCWALCGQCTQL